MALRPDIRTQLRRRRGLAATAAAALAALGAAEALAAFAEQKLVAPAANAAAGMAFGSAVAVDGNTLVVGAPSDDYVANDEGSAYVYVRQAAGAAWTQAARLVASNPNPFGGDERFGTSVAVQGDVIVVGAPWYDLFGASSDEGVAFVFVKPSGGWSGTLMPSARLQASNPNPFGANEHVGISVALDGDVIAVGADSYELVSAASDEGAVFVYRKPAGGWSGTLTESALLEASVPNPFGGPEGLGRSVAIAGSTIVAGADLYDLTAAGSDEGAAFVFLEPTGGWSGLVTEAARLQQTAPNPFGHVDHFGHSIAIAGDTVVVGCDGYDLVNKSSDEGAAFVFVKPAGGWSGVLTETAQLRAAVPNPHGSDEFFGSSVAMSGTEVAVGARSYDLSPSAPNPSNEGAVFLFARPAAGWSGIRTEDTLLVATDASIGDELGLSVALKNHDLVAGASLADVGALVDAGAAYAFLLPGPGAYAVPGLHGASAALAALALAAAALGTLRHGRRRAAPAVATPPTDR